MGVRPGKFPTSTLAFVGHGCATSIHQIDHHNIGIGSDTIADAVFISGFVTGASHLHFRFLSKPSETQSGLSLKFKVQTLNSVIHPDFQSPKLGCED
jgi:hypothetical protein